MTTTPGTDESAAPMDGVWGTIALDPAACTSCMLCARECPDWCIHIDSHAVSEVADGPGARPRTVHVLDRFAIDFGLCMYCGICIEVCPFDALEWAGDSTAVAVVPPGASPAVAAGALIHEIDLLAAARAPHPTPPAP